VISQAAFFPAGRPAAAEPAERFGLELEAGSAGEGVEVRLRSRRFLYAARVEAGGYAAEAPRVWVEPGVERRVLLARDPGVEPGGTVAVSALNLRGRLSAPIA
jgi:hypothetical protein